MVNSIEILWEIKNKTTIWSNNSTPKYLFEENGNSNSKGNSPLCSLLNYLQDIKSIWTPINGGWTKMWYIWILISHKKERNLSICDNMDGPRGYYTKWNKSNRERHTLYNVSLYVDSKKQNKWTNIKQL